MKFAIASNTVRSWYKRYKLEGYFSSKKAEEKKGRVSAEEVVHYVKNNLNFIFLKMGRNFGVSGPGALYWIQKLGYSYKKASTHVETSEEKRNIIKIMQY